MSARITILPQSRWCLLGRLVWLCTAAVHVAPLVAAIGKLWLAPETGLALRTAALAASLVFFASKVFGVRYLPATERPVVGIVVFLLACGLLHNELRSTIVNEAEPYFIALVATVSGAALAGAACRIARSLRRFGATSVARPVLPRLIRVLRDVGRAPAPQLLLLTPRSPRGPPR